MYASTRVTTTTAAAAAGKTVGGQTTMRNHVRVKPIGLLEASDMQQEVGALVYPVDYVECLHTLKGLGISLGKDLVDSDVVERNAQRIESMLGAEDDHDYDSDSERSRGSVSGVDSSSPGSEKTTDFVVMRRREYTDSYLPAQKGAESLDSDKERCLSAMLETINRPIPSTFAPTVIAITLRTVGRGVILPGAEICFLSDHIGYSAMLKGLLCKHSTLGIEESNELKMVIGHVGVVTSGKVSHTRGCCSIGMGYCVAQTLHRYITSLRKWHVALTYPEQSTPKFVVMVKNPRSKVEILSYFDIHCCGL